MWGMFSQCITHHHVAVPLFVMLCCVLLPFFAKKGGCPEF
jgi:hypothetical protein